MKLQMIRVEEKITDKMSLITFKIKGYRINRSKFLIVEMLCYSNKTS